MPVDIEVDELNQPAVLWPFARADNYGKALVDQGEEIYVRWIDNAADILDPDYNNVVFDSVAVVDREIPVESLMWKGRLSEWEDSGSTTANNRLLQVKKLLDTPDIKCRVNRRLVGLMRYTGTVPYVS